MRLLSSLILLLLSAALAATTVGTLQARAQEAVQWIAFARSEAMVRPCATSPAQIMRGVPGSDAMQPIISNLGMVIRISFSPDGTNLVYDTSDAQFTTQRNSNGSGTSTVCNHSLYIYDMDSGENRRLDVPVADAYAPAWSPNGDWIAFTGRERTLITALTGMQQYINEYFIYKVRPDGTGFEKLAITAQLGRPSWSPDGQLIVYPNGDRGQEELYVIEAHTNTPARRLTYNSTSELTPVFSPDGAHIAFLSDRNNTPNEHDVFIMRANGTLPRQIEETQFFSGAFTFYEGSSSIIFVQDVFSARFYLMQIEIGDNEGMNRSADGSFVETLTEEVEVQNPDGSTSTILQTTTRVTRLPTPQRVSPEDSANYWAPTLSPEVEKSGAVWPLGLLAGVVFGAAVWLMVRAPQAVPVGRRFAAERTTKEKDRAPFSRL